MPLYIKSPIPSSCDTSTGTNTELEGEDVLAIKWSPSPSTVFVAAERNEDMSVTPLPKIATVRSGPGRRSLLPEAQAQEPPTPSRVNQSSNSNSGFYAQQSSDGSCSYFKAPEPGKFTVITSGPKLQRPATSALSETPRPHLNRPKTCGGRTQALTKSKVSKSALILMANDEESASAPCVRHSSTATQTEQRKGKIAEIDARVNEICARKAKQKARSGLEATASTQFHPTNPFAEEKGSLGEAVALLQASAEALFQKMELHPQTLKQIVDWQVSPSILPTDAQASEHSVPVSPVPPEENWKLPETNTQAIPARPRESLSSYFPNSTPFPSKRAYKYKATAELPKTPFPAASPSNFLDIRDSLSNISLVPFVSSTCPSPPSTPDSPHSEISESDISETESLEIMKELPKAKKSLPVLRSKMRKLMRTLSSLNAVPDVLDIFIENLPPVVKLSPENFKRLTPNAVITESKNHGRKKSQVREDLDSLKRTVGELVASYNDSKKSSSKTWIVESEPPSDSQSQAIEEDKSDGISISLGMKLARTRSSSAHWTSESERGRSTQSKPLPPASAPSSKTAVVTPLRGSTAAFINRKSVDLEETQVVLKKAPKLLKPKKKRRTSSTATGSTR